MVKHHNEIRCFCNRKPLLAVYGVDTSGKIFIHVKVYKQSRIYAELFISDGAQIKIRCRECLRLHKIKIVSGRPLLQEEKEAMDSISVDSAPSQVADHHIERLR